MVDDLRRSASSALGLDDVVDLLRDDAAKAELRFNRSLDAMEIRVMAAISAAREDLTSYEAAHGKEHSAQRFESETAHREFREFKSAAELAQAHRDGALGVIRYIADLAGRNWKALAAIAAGVAAATGSIHLTIGGTLP